MVPFFFLLIICLVGAVALAAAIQFFLRPGPWKALGYGCLIIAVFMLFAASGMWDTPVRHDWAGLTAVFALMLITALVSLKFGRHFWHWWQQHKGK